MLDIDHHIHVSGTGSFVPERIVTNEILRDLVTNYDEESGPFGPWVDRVTHVNKRRILDPDLSSGDMAREACRQAIEDSGVDPAEIGLFVMATFTTKNIYPGEQTMLTEELGMNGAATFYLTAGCAGSVYGLHVANAFLRSGFYKHALVVGTEHLTSCVDFTDPITAIIFGDGAGAAVVSRRDEAGPGGVVQRCVLGSSYAPTHIVMNNTNVPKRSEQITADVAGTPTRTAVRQFIEMEAGPRVLRNAVVAMAEATVASLGFTMDDLKRDEPALRELLNRARLIPHQANGRIIDGLTDRLRIDEEQVYKTVYDYGNISCASNIITLDYALKRGTQQRVLDDEGKVLEVKHDVGSKIESGDLVVVPTVGAGYLTGCFTYVAD